MTAVSVIVPVRNAETHLRETLAGIGQQKLSDLEIIIVDDGSTDASPAIIAEFAAADPRVKVIPGPAVGSAGAARNAGLDIAQGDFLIFLDADDRFSPLLLTKLYAKALADDADVVVNRFRVFEYGAEPVTMDWGLRTDYLPARTPFAPDAVGDALFYAFGPVAWNKLFRAELIRANGLRFQELPRTNDLFFSFAALACAQRISYVDRPLIDYRVGNADSLQGSADRSPLDFAEALRALKGWLHTRGLDDRFGGALANEAVEVCLSALDRAPSWTAFCQIDAALRGSLLAELGVLGREPSGFVSAGLAQRLTDYLASDKEQYLFDRAARLDRKVRAARAEARAAARSVAGQPVPRPEPVPAADAGAEPAATDATSPDVSVIIPVHNTAAWLSECLAGVQRQTGVRLEVICVDDGSDDASPELLAQAASADPRIQVITQPNAGLSAARNTGMAAATGRYVCFLDSDDFWGPDALAGLVAAADTSRAELLMFDADTVAEPGVDARTLARYHDRYYHRTHEYPEVSTGAELMTLLKAAGEYRVQACLYVIRRDLLQRTGLRFRPGLPREDNLFTFELLLAAQRAGHRPVPLYTRRLRPGSLITASGRASAARGYYLSFVEMLRATRDRRFDEHTGPGVGATAFKAYKQAHEHFVRLEPEVGDALGTLDLEPDAQAVFRILQLAREDTRRARGVPPAPKPKVAPTPSPASPHPLRRLRRFAGRNYRRLRGWLRHSRPAH